MSGLFCIMGRLLISMPRFPIPAQGAAVRGPTSPNVSLEGGRLVVGSVPSGWTRPEKDEFATVGICEEGTEEAVS